MATWAARLSAFRPLVLPGGTFLAVLGQTYAMTRSNEHLSTSNKHLFDQVTLQQRVAEKQFMPLPRVAFNLREPRLSLHNDGMGPMIIEKIQFVVEDDQGSPKPNYSPKDLIAPHLHPCVAGTAFTSGRTVIRRESYVDLLRLSKTAECLECQPQVKAAVIKLLPFRLEVTYTDVFGTKYDKFVDHSREYEAPHLRFDSYHCCVAANAGEPFKVPDKPTQA